MIQYYPGAIYSPFVYADWFCMCMYIAIQGGAKYKYFCIYDAATCSFGFVGFNKIDGIHKIELAPGHVNG